MPDCKLLSLSPLLRLAAMHCEVWYSHGHCRRVVPLTTRASAPSALDAVCCRRMQDSRAVIDAKSAQLLVTAKVKELQQAVQQAAAENAALVNANLINPDVRYSPRESCFPTLIGSVVSLGVFFTVSLNCSFCPQHHGRCGMPDSCRCVYAGDGLKHDHADGLGGGRGRRCCRHARRAGFCVGLPQALGTRPPVYRHQAEGRRCISSTNQIQEQEQYRNNS